MSDKTTNGSGGGSNGSAGGAGHGHAHGSLLESLRAQSEAARGADQASRRPAEEALSELDRRLWRSFKWLDEAMSHLEVIRPAVKHAFRIPDVLTLEAPQFEQGFLSFRRKPVAGLDLIEHIELFYRLAASKPIELRVPPAAASGVEDKLRIAQMRFEYRTEHDERRVVRQSVFTVTPAVTASLKFTPDYRRQTIEVAMRNVDRFESVSLEFPADKFDESALEDLIRFMMGEDNAFLRRAPLAGVGVRRVPKLEEPVVYRIEKTAHRR